MLRTLLLSNIYNPTEQPQQEENYEKEGSICITVRFPCNFGSERMRYVQNRFCIGAATVSSGTAQTDSAQASASVASKGKITVAATEVPHAEILEAAKPILAKEGWDLESNGV